MNFVNFIGLVVCLTGIAAHVVTKATKGRFYDVSVLVSVHILGGSLSPCHEYVCVYARVRVRGGGGADSARSTRKLCNLEARCRLSILAI